MPKKLGLLNVELGRPIVEEALRKMSNALSTYKRQGVKVMTLTHGYGSSGAILPSVLKRGRRITAEAECHVTVTFH